MYHMFAVQRDTFLSRYHQRSNVETTFSMIKGKFVNWKKVNANGEVKDPWNTPLKFACPGNEDKEGIDVSSAGPDRKWDTGDDVNSWKL